MAFRFPLQALLRFRESFERRERLLLELATREVVRTRRQVEDAKTDREGALEEMASHLKSGLAGVELQFEVASDSLRKRHIVVLGEQLEKLDTQRLSQLQAYQKAQKQRKILENLRDRQRALYRVEQERRAQQQMDERFLIRRGESDPG